MYNTMTYYSHSQKYDTEEISKANPVGIDYLVRNERIKNDCTRLIPAKTIEWFRADWGAPHGYTYIGHNKAWLNESLKETPEFKEEVDAHECDHCPVELTTRYISRDRVKQEPKEDIIQRLVDKYSYLYNNYSKN